MSLEDHPNFHAVKFTTDIMSSFFASLRGTATPETAPDIRQEVMSFVYDIEQKVNKRCKKEEEIT